MTKLGFIYFVILICRLARRNLLGVLFFNEGGSLHPPASTRPPRLTLVEAGIEASIGVPAYRQAGFDAGIKKVEIFDPYHGLILSHTHLSSQKIFISEIPI